LKKILLICRVVVNFAKNKQLPATRRMPYGTKCKPVQSTA
jgi:hypothetical protein